MLEGGPKFPRFFYFKCISFEFNRYPPTRMVTYDSQNNDALIKELKFRSN